MWSLMLEAFGAMCILVFIVWWTMFSGRPPEQAAKSKSTAGLEPKKADPQQAPAEDQ